MCSYVLTYINTFYNLNVVEYIIFINYNFLLKLNECELSVGIIYL